MRRYSIGCVNGLVQRFLHRWGVCVLLLAGWKLAVGDANIGSSEVRRRRSRVGNLSLFHACNDGEAM